MGSGTSKPASAGPPGKAAASYAAPTENSSPTKTRPRRSSRSRASTHRDDSSHVLRDDPFWLLFLDPPQQCLELSATNRYSWEGATAWQERGFYRAAWEVLNDEGLARALLDAVRAEPDERFPVFIGGCVALNYHLLRRFHAPVAVPTSDVDFKVDIGEFMRKLLAARTDAPAGADKSEWSVAEAAAVQACFDQALAGFASYAQALLERMRLALVAVLPSVEAALAPHGIRVGPQGVRVFHKTHAAGRSGKPPLNLVPLSGGVFQLVVEMLPPAADGAAEGAAPFLWNVVDLESDWRSPKGRPRRVARPRPSRWLQTTQSWRSTGCVSSRPPR